MIQAFSCSVQAHEQKFLRHGVGRQDRLTSSSVRTTAEVFRMNIMSIGIWSKATMNGAVGKHKFVQAVTVDTVVKAVSFETVRQKQ